MSSHNELEPIDETPTDDLITWKELTEEEAVPPKKTKIKAMAMNRMVWIMAGIAVVCLAGGIGISQLVISPSQAAAETEPPAAGPITVPVEKRPLSNDVILRGDARYDDAVNVKLETGDLGGPAVVTGAVPKVGDELKAGSIALEVVGRPVIVLPGELPVYRSLIAGASGPDVVQLRWALGQMGYAVGEGDVYDSTLGSAVRELFAQAGYSAPQAEKAIQEQLKAAEQAVTSAQQALNTANSAIEEADKGPSSATRIQLDNAVNQAERQLTAARNCKPDPKGEPCPSLADAEDALNLAKAQRADGLQPASLDSQYVQRDEAAKALNDAQGALAEIQGQNITPLPASEVLYLPSLPRRVDTVNVSRGSTVPTTAAFSVSGATLEIEASASQTDADLLSVNQKATMFLGEKSFPAVIKEINKSSKKAGSEGGEGSGSDNRVQVILTPDTKISEEERTALVGENVRLVIPVSSTDGTVLAVPVAALTAGAGGETRVQVLREGAEEPELVVVKTGLSAEGLAEIVSSEKPLAEGDLVVVGS